ncbi:hypothetical protein CVT25_004093 [Psilocybe cyanescens]|uniref:Uncharacterized protein n=1 Tax=Psilocybe cyanescens TaxID=93625 RepID=A0A409X8W9_PSICY|nr:hypothetical protein CVT25_004093 [Psilocybe cyanescens]
MHLCDLPNEILLQIINEKLLCADDLYYVATLSRLLHSIALPMYLRIYELHDPTSYSAVHVSRKPAYLVRPSLDGLSGLAISTKLTTIDYLVCNLYGFRASDSAFQVMECKLQQLCRVIQRLERITRFRLCLLGTFAPQDGRRIPDKDLRTWTTSIGGLLNGVIDKGCLELTVHSGCWSEDPYHFHSVNPSKNPLTTVRYLAKSFFVDSRSPELFLRGLNWEFVRPQERGYSKSILMHTSPQSLTPSALHSFAIQSRIFLIPPYLSWTMSVLSLGTNITSLTFRITQLKPGIWKVILTRLGEVMSNRLREVYFQPGCYGLDFRDLLAFLSKTPCLTHLEVHNSCKVTIPDPCIRESLITHHCSLIVPHLPNLQFLIAPLSVASHLLSKYSESSISPLPSLREWVVFFEAGKIFGDYAYVVDCCQRHTEIRERIITGNSPQSVPRLSVHILGRPYSYRTPLFPDEDKFIDAEATGTLPQFPHITRAIYDLMPTKQELLEGVNSFLTAVDLRFPELREITISERIMDRMSKDTADGLEDERYMRSKTVEDVLSLLQRRFRKLERVATEKTVHLLK